MNKSLRILLTLSFAVYTTALWAHADNSNLVVNAGFEAGDFFGWTVSGGPTVTGVCNASACPGNHVHPEENAAGYFGTVGETFTFRKPFPRCPVTPTFCRSTWRTR